MVWKRLKVRWIPGLTGTSYHLGAAGMETAPRRWIEQAGRFTHRDMTLMAGIFGIRIGQGRQQRLGVGMLGPVQEGLHRCLFHHASGIHYHHSMGVVTYR